MMRSNKNYEIINISKNYSKDKFISIFNDTYKDNNLNPLNPNNDINTDCIYINILRWTLTNPLRFL